MEVPDKIACFTFLLNLRSYFEMQVCFWTVSPLLIFGIWSLKFTLLTTPYPKQREFVSEQTQCEKKVFMEERRRRSLTSREHNEAGIKMTTKGTCPTMSHLFRIFRSSSTLRPESNMWTPETNLVTFLPRAFSFVTISVCSTNHFLPRSKQKRLGCHTRHAGNHEQRRLLLFSEQYVCKSHECEEGACGHVRSCCHLRTRHRLTTNLPSHSSTSAKPT